MFQVARQAEQHGVAGVHVHARDVDAVGAHPDPVVAPVAPEQEHVDPVAARPRVLPAYDTGGLAGPGRRGEQRVEGLLGYARISGGDRERHRDGDREHARDQAGEDLPPAGQPAGPQDDVRTDDQPEPGDGTGPEHQRDLAQPAERASGEAGVRAEGHAHDGDDHGQVAAEQEQPGAPPARAQVRRPGQHRRQRHPADEGGGRGRRAAATRRRPGAVPGCEIRGDHASIEATRAPENPSAARAGTVHTGI